MSEQKLVEIKVNRTYCEVGLGAMTGAEIRQLANPPIKAEHELWHVRYGEDVKIGDADVVGVAHGARFYSTPRYINQSAPTEERGEPPTLIWPDWATEEPAPEPVGPCCDTCGESHWYNFFVPDDVWEQIAPLDGPSGGGGTLCVRCIDKRCAELGIKATGRFHFTGKAVSTHPPAPSGGLREITEKLEIAYGHAENTADPTLRLSHNSELAKRVMGMVHEALEIARTALDKEKPHQKATQEGATVPVAALAAEGDPGEGEGAEGGQNEDMDAVVPCFDAGCVCCAAYTKLCRKYEDQIEELHDMAQEKSDG